MADTRKETGHQLAQEVFRHAQWWGRVDVEDRIAIWVLVVSVLLEARQLWIIWHLLHFDHGLR
jgi:hypothetical protein